MHASRRSPSPNPEEAPWLPSISEWTAERETLRKLVRDFRDLELSAHPDDWEHAELEKLSERKAETVKGMKIDKKSIKELKEKVDEKQKGGTVVSVPSAVTLGPSSFQVPKEKEETPVSAATLVSDELPNSRGRKRGNDPKEIVARLFPGLVEDSLLDGLGNEVEEAEWEDEATENSIDYHRHDENGLKQGKKDVVIDPTLEREARWRALERDLPKTPRADQPMFGFAAAAREVAPVKAQKVFATSKVAEFIRSPQNAATAKVVSQLADQVKELQKQLDTVRRNRPSERGRPRFRSVETRTTRQPLGQSDAGNLASSRSKSAQQASEQAIKSPTRGKRKPAASSSPRRQTQDRTNENHASEEQIYDIEAQRLRLDEMEEIVEPGLRQEELTLANGTLLRMYAGNVTLECFVNGAVRIRLPNGETSTSFTNGDVCTEFASGEQVYYYASNGCIESTFADGSSMVEYPDGSIECDGQPFEPGYVAV